MKLFGKELLFNNNKIYHAGSKPTPSEIGAAASSHTHNYAGSSSAGGAANAAVKLATARTINGTNFDGTGNITTANWGTARNIYVADANGTNTGVAVSVNGSGNATLKLPSTIKASLSGNASTATTLATARTINGTSFNGSANITTANWGTARTLTIGKTGKSVNGSANVSWTLSEIGAAASSHTHSSLTGTAGTTIAPSTGTGVMRYDYSISSSNAGTLPVSNNANGILTFNTYSGNYYSQLGFSSNGSLYYRNFNGTALNTTTEWRKILTASEMANNQNGFYDKIVYTNVDGVTEIGRHLDFHMTNDKTKDYDVRMFVDEETMLRTTSPMKFGGYADYALQAGTSHYGAYVENKHTGKSLTLTYTGDTELGGNHIYIQAGMYDSRLQSGNYQIFNTNASNTIYFGNQQSYTIIEGKGYDLRLNEGKLEYSGGFISVNQARGDHGFGTSDRYGGFIGRFTGWDADCVYINTYSSGIGYEAPSYSRVKINGHFLNVAAMATFESSLDADCIYSNNALNVSSDRNLKENIEYIRKKEEIATLDTNSEKLTLKDMYNFVKDELVLATYNMKNNKSNNIKLNFIAQDLLYNNNYEESKVGQLIVDAKYARENETALKYDTGNYTSVIVGALQYAIDKIEMFETKINSLAK